MSVYGILRVEKCKAAAVTAMQRHNDRQNRNYSNEGIDRARSSLNREWVQHTDYADEVQARIQAGRTASGKVRKDAVVLVEGIVTASPEWFSDHTDEEAEAYFQRAYEFVCDLAGADNLVHYTLHMDEQTPHVHFGFVPLKDGALSWKKFFPGKGSLSQLQDDFWRDVSSQFGMERGVQHTPDEAPRHRSVAEYKAEAAREADRLDRLRRSVEQGSLEVSRDLSANRAGATHLEELEAEARDLAGEVRELEQRARGLELRVLEARGHVAVLRERCERALEALRAVLRGASARLGLTLEHPRPTLDETISGVRHVRRVDLASEVQHTAENKTAHQR